MIFPGRHFSPFKTFLSRADHVALILNPKVATTFTRAMLVDGYREFDGRQDPSQGRYRLLSIARRFPVAPVRDYVDFLRHQPDYATYAFVRNPYSRLLSAWRNKFLDGHLRAGGAASGYTRDAQREHLPKARRFAAASGLPGAGEGELVPFETFLRYVGSRPPGRRDHHWDEQGRVLMCDRLAYMRLYRMEDDLEEGFAEIFPRLGFPEDWVMARLARPVNRSNSEKPVYTPALAALARDLCGDDFARFGYDEASWQGL